MLLDFLFSFLNSVSVDLDFVYDSMWNVDFKAKLEWIVDFRSP